MILKKTNSWLEKDFMTKKSTRSRIAGIIEILSLDHREFIIADGKFFIHSAISSTAFEKMCQGYSLELLNFKNSVILLQEFEFKQDINGRAVLLVTECTYLGEGSFSGNFIDFNKKEIASKVKVRNLKIGNHDINTNPIKSYKISAKEEYSLHKLEKGTTIKPLNDAIVSRFLNYTGKASFPSENLTKVKTPNNNHKTHPTISDGALNVLLSFKKDRSCLDVNDSPRIVQNTGHPFTTSIINDKVNSTIQFNLNNRGDTNITDKKYKKDSVCGFTHEMQHNSPLINLPYRSNKILHEQDNSINSRSPRIDDSPAPYTLRSRHLASKEDQSLKNEQKRKTSISRKSVNTPLKDISNSLPEVKKFLSNETTLTISSLPLSLIGIKDSGNRNSLSKKLQRQTKSSFNIISLNNGLSNSPKVPQSYTLESNETGQQCRVLKSNKVSKQHKNTYKEIQKIQLSDLDSFDADISILSETNSTITKTLNKEKLKIKSKTDKLKSQGKASGASKSEVDKSHQNIIASNKIDNYSLENSSIIFDRIDSSLNSENIYITDSFIKHQCLPSEDSSICPISLESVQFTPTFNFFSEFKPSFSQIDDEIFSSSKQSCKTITCVENNEEGINQTSNVSKNVNLSTSFNMSLENYISSSKWLNSSNYPTSAKCTSKRRFLIDSSEDNNMIASPKTIKSKFVINNIRSNQIHIRKNAKTSEYFNARFLRSKHNVYNISYMSKCISNSRRSSEIAKLFNSKFISSRFARETDRINYMSPRFVFKKRSRQNCMSSCLDKYYQAKYRYKFNNTPDVRCEIMSLQIGIPNNFVFKKEKLNNNSASVVVYKSLNSHKAKDAKNGKNHQNSLVIDKIDLNEIKTVSSQLTFEKGSKERNKSELSTESLSETKICDPHRFGPPSTAINKDSAHLSQNHDHDRVEFKEAVDNRFVSDLYTDISQSSIPYFHSFSFDSYVSSEKLTSHTSQVSLKDCKSSFISVPKNTQQINCYEQCEEYMLTRNTNSVITNGTEFEHSYSLNSTDSCHNHDIFNFLSNEDDVIDEAIDKSVLIYDFIDFIQSG